MRQRDRSGQTGFLWADETERPGGPGEGKVDDGKRAEEGVTSGVRAAEEGVTFGLREIDSEAERLAAEMALATQDGDPLVEDAANQSVPLVHEQNETIVGEILADIQPSTFVPTEEQAKAIEHVHGPMLVVAGAGTGKTTVLTQRIAGLMRNGHAKPNEILAITYTKNSARDLTKRLAAAWLGRDDAAAMRQVMDAGIRVGTFHAYCYSILCDAGKRFELVDEQDMYVLLRRQVEDLNLEHFITAGNLGKFLTDLLSVFRRCSDELRGPADYDKYVADLVAGRVKPPRVCPTKQKDALSDDEVIARCQEIARVFHIVEDKLTAAGLGTYGDVISRTIELLSDKAGRVHLERARKRARFILIDEFQDSNVAQIKLAKLLAGDEANVFAVGDPDQAIYRFRGATSGAFDQFLAAFGAERVKRATMSENRRSTDAILRCAYAAIEKNPQISSVTLPGGETWERQPLVHARSKAEPDRAPLVRVIGSPSKENEGAYIADEIERRRKAGREWREMAVLYRQHSHREDVMRELRGRGIPFVVEGIDLLETTEVRDLLAVLVAVQSRDAVAVLRACSLPCFSVNGAELRAVLAAAGEELDVEKVIKQAPGGAAVVTALAEARHQLEAAEGKAVVAIDIAQRCFGLAPNRNCDEFAEFVARWAKKPAAISRDGSLGEFLEYLKLFEEANGRVCRPEYDADGTPLTLQMESGEAHAAKPESNAVHLMTAHAAKGLEFAVVFVARVGSGCFPSSYREYLVEFPDELRNRENIPEGDPKTLHEQEERRLFYVTMTRAEDELILAGSYKSKNKPVPSGYLRELVDLKKKQLAGGIEFEELAEGMSVTLQAGAAPQPRILEWVGMAARESSRGLRLSPSAIESYQHCPLRYKLNRDWKLPDEPAAPMQFGQAVHKALMGYFDAVQKGKTVAPEAVIASFLDEFAKAKIAEPLQRDLYERAGRRQLLAFLNSRAAVPHGQVLMVEHKINLQVAGTEITGRIDRVDEDADGLTIIDYKTGHPKNQDIADKSLQLSIYALAMAQQKPVKAVIFENLEDSSTVATVRTARDLTKAEEIIAECAESIRDGEFDPKPGMYCSWCAYRMICPEHELVNIAPAAKSAAVN